MTIRHSIPQSRELEGDIHSRGSVPISSPVPSMTDSQRDAIIQELRESTSGSPGNLAQWNDLGVHLALKGEYREAIGAFGSALNLDPEHPGVAANLHQVAQAQMPEGALPLPVAPGHSGRLGRRDPYVDMRSLLDLDAPLIIDGGANRGNTVLQLRQQFPDATIHAFEPIQELAQALRQRFPDDKKLTVHAAALSDSEGTIEFHVRAKDVMSSMLEPSETKKRYQGANTESVRIIETLKVRLDKVLSKPIDAMKLDLQGHEIHAMQGAGDLIENVRVILTEIEFISLYDGQPTFGDVDAFMRSKGFRLFSLYELWYHPAGQVTAGDAIYVNERYYS